MIDYKTAALNAASHSYYVGDAFSDLPATGMAVGDLAFDKATGIFYTASTATTLTAINPGTFIFTKGITLADPTAVTALTVTPWVAPFACTVTAIKGYRVGGTGATVQAYRNTTATPLRSAALSLTSSLTWMTASLPLQNTGFSTGNSLMLAVLTVAGSATEVSLQVEFTRP
jgi:hypothetical protein